MAANCSFQLVSSIEQKTLLMFNLWQSFLIIMIHTSCTFLKELLEQSRQQRKRFVYYSKYNNFDTILDKIRYL